MNDLEKDRLRALTSAFNVLPKGTVIFLPEDDYLFLERACIENSERLYGRSFPWAGRKHGGLLCRGKEFFAVEDLECWGT
jgi:hypothetical protein